MDDIMYQRKIDMPFPAIVKTTLPKLQVPLGNSATINESLALSTVVKVSTPSSVAYSLEGEKMFVSRTRFIY